MSTPSDADRLIELEQLVSHLQRDVDHLNAVLIDQQRQFDFLKTVLGRMDERLTRMSVGEDKFDLRAEKPPHY